MAFKSNDPNIVCATALGTGVRAADGAAVETQVLPGACVADGLQLAVPAPTATTAERTKASRTQRISKLPFWDPRQTQFIAWS
jgi:hypothetical protein